MSTRIPTRIRGLNVLAILWVVAALAWIAPEGDLMLDIALAAAGVALVVVWWLARWFGGREVGLPLWLGLASLAGLAWGLGASGLVVVLMGLKTGLHAHGPEYSSAEVAWVWRQIPFWIVAGLPAGLGVGLLAAALQSGRPPADVIPED